MCLCLYTYFSVVFKAFYSTSENFLQFSVCICLLSSPETLHSFSITVQLLQVCQLSKAAPALVWGCFSWFHASFVNKMCKSMAAVQSTQSTGRELRARLAAGAPGSVKWRQCWRWAQLHPGWTCQSPELSSGTPSPQWHLQLCQRAAGRAWEPQSQKNCTDLSPQPSLHRMDHFCVLGWAIFLPWGGAGRKEQMPVPSNGSKHCSEIFIRVLWPFCTSLRHQEWSSIPTLNGAQFPLCLDHRSLVLRDDCSCLKFILGN